MGTAQLEHHVTSIQRVQSGVYSQALSRYRDPLVQRVASERPLVHQPLVPHILTACYQVVLLARNFGEWPLVAQDVCYAVAVFLQFVQRILIASRSTKEQSTHTELLRHGPPAPTSITARHVQALRANLRAETLSHAAGLTSYTTFVLVGLWQIGIYRTGSWT